MSAPELGAVTGATSDMIAEVKVRDWVHAQVALEVDRLREQGARAIVVGVNNMAIYREDGVVVNRVEVDTTFDFTKVRMLLVSTPSTCWEKPGFAYVNLVLFTEKPVPLLLPYLYQRDLQPDNDLRQWVFINKKGERARHEVSQLEDVEAE